MRVKVKFCLNLFGLLLLGFVVIFISKLKEDNTKTINFSEILRGFEQTSDKLNVIQSNILAPPRLELNQNQDDAATQYSNHLYGWEENTEIFRPYFHDREDTAHSFFAIFLYSAVIRDNNEIYRDKSTISDGYTHAIHASGWEQGRSETNNGVKCCFVWKNGDMTSSESVERTYPSSEPKRRHFAAAHYACFTNTPHEIDRFFLVSTAALCVENMYRNIKPVLPLTNNKNGSIGLCLKILYGHVDVKLLVDWMEFYKEMKVDKVLVKVFNVSNLVHAILQHYASEGFIEISPFDIPWKEKHTKPPFSLYNERVAMLDCHERLSQYTYFIIIDLDEFLVAKQNTDFKELLVLLECTYPGQHAYLFQSEMFLKDWGGMNDTNGSDLERYIEHTSAEKSRPKYIALTSSIRQGRLTTHTFQSVYEESLKTVNSSIAVIKHYRYAYDQHDVNNTRMKDISMLTMVDKIRPRTSRVLKQFGII